ncbi:MAG: flagellin, partial [Sedimentisphaerales bacterium]|nr:flagellin [Sedimentisphaerales bacterium]
MFSINNIAISNVVNTLTRLGTELAISNERLVTGLRVNRAVDDPSGIVALSNFNAEIARIDARTTNGTRINSIIDTADGAMVEIEDLLDVIDVAISSASADPANLATYQATIDTALNSIDSIVSTTSFNGDTLLDGGIGYTVTGVDSSELANVRVHSLDTASGDVSLEISTASVAQKAEIAYAGGTLTDDVTLTITGSSGSKEYNFASGTARATIRDAINVDTATTGVEAELPGPADYLYLRSSEAGSDQIVSISVTAGTFNMRDGTTSDTGSDVGVTLNGDFAATSGNIAHYRSGNTAIDITVADGFSGTAT